MDDGLLDGGVCYIREFDSADIGQEMEDDHRALKRKIKWTPTIAHKQ
jgi:hypothetical protein